MNKRCRRKNASNANSPSFPCITKNFLACIIKVNLSSSVAVAVELTSTMTAVINASPAVKVADLPSM